MGKGWDDYSFEKSKQLYDAGESMGQISRALGQEGYTLSRSAIIGKLNRAGHNKTSQAATRQRPMRHLEPKPKPKADPLVEVVKKAKPLLPIGGEKTLEYIGPIGTTPAWGYCQFTRDDIQKRDAEGRPAWQMCGHRAQVKGAGRNAVTLPWCEEHARICHQPQQSKKNVA